MALMQTSFYAQTLQLCTQVNVILPQQTHGIGVAGSASKKDRYPVLYLLHGASDDHTIWLRRTNIERYVAQMGLAVVMPEVHLSRYENMTHGPRYYDYITQELPQIMQTFFPISGKPEEQFIAGLSMGGMGALKFGLTRPEQYAAVGIFSSGNLFYRAEGHSMPLKNRPSGKAPLHQAIYGDLAPEELKGSQWDPFPAAEKALKEGKAMPRFYHVCGTEDFLLDSARLTKQWFEKHPEIEYRYQEAPGAHTWDFWDTWIQDFLQWLDL